MTRRTTHRPCLAQPRCTLVAFTVLLMLAVLWSTSMPAHALGAAAAPATAPGGPSVAALVLVDPTTDTDLRTIAPGEVIDLTGLPGRGLNVRAVTAGADPPGSVRFQLAGPRSASRTENAPPYALFGDDAGDFHARTLPLGRYSLSATAFTGRSGRGEAGKTTSIEFEITKSAGDLAVTRLVLVDAVTDRDLRLLGDGDSLDLTELGTDKLSVRAEVGGSTPVGSVVLELGGDRQGTRRENVAPYALFGDKSGDYWGRSFRKGTYTLRATPHIERGGRGAAGESLAVSFSVIRSAGDVSISRLVLVDSQSNADIMTLSDGAVIDLTTVGSEKFNIRAETDGVTSTESVAFKLRGPYEKARSDNSAPFSLFGDKQGSYYGVRLKQGEYTVQATPHVERNGKGSAGPAMQVSFSVIKSAGDLAVTGFVVVDPVSDGDIATLTDGMVIDLLQLPGESFTVRAQTGGQTPPGSVVLSITGPFEYSRTENQPPHALFGDNNGDYRGGRLGVGHYVLSAAPHIERNGGGAPGRSLTVTFSVVRGDVDGSSSLLDAGPSPHGISVADAVRFLTQSTFGPTKASIQELRQVGYEAWLDAQLALAPSLHRPYLDRYLAGGGTRGRGKSKRTEAWFYNAAQAPDQLCQRVAFALSEIFVVSDRDPGLSSSEHAFGLAGYYDVLLRHCFGSFRDLVEEVTLSPVMGTFLTLVNNRKPDPVEGTMPDENYSRELKQLFTIGLCELAQDGSRLPAPDGECIPTFDQPDVEGGARVLTGWTYTVSDDHAEYGRRGRRLIDPMSLVPEYHDDGEKEVLGAFLPAKQGAETDLDSYLDVIFEHPNVGPFIGRRLIQRLVTSNPGPGYVARVAGAFNDNGRGVRGDLGAVVRTILLDVEARDPTLARVVDFGKVREPLLLPIALWRGLSAGTLAGERYRYDHPEDAFGQAPLRAPSVFNFFLPDYQHPGEVAELGLYSPELQIVTETRIVATANELYVWVYSRRGRELYRVDEEIGVSEAACERLADHLAALFLAGSMSTALHDAITGISCDRAIRASDRVRDSIYLVLTSPEFSVQR